MNYKEIKKIAVKYIDDLGENVGEELQIEESSTIEEKEFYVFFFNTKKFIETEDISYMFVGVGPIIIVKETGKVYNTGTAFPIEYYIDNFIKFGDPNKSDKKKVDVNSMENDDLIDYIENLPGNKDINKK